MLSAALLAALSLLPWATPHPRAASAAAPPSPQTASPIFSVDDEVVAMAFSPDGRLAYAVRRIVTIRKYEMERDDIYMLYGISEKKRIVNGEKLVQSRAPFSYAILSLRWSPDGSKLTAEMNTSMAIDAAMNTRDSTGTLLIDQQGKEIKIAGADSVSEEGLTAAWLTDETTVGFLIEVVKPRLLFGLGSVRPVAGRGGRIFNTSTFAGVAWNTTPKEPLSAVAVERDASLGGPTTLVLLDLVKETKRNLASLSGYAGQISFSPSAKRIAYFSDPDTLEVRDAQKPDRLVRLKLPLGPYVWDADERRILWKRVTPGKKTGTLAWVTIPELLEPKGPTAPPAIEAAPAPILSGVEFRDFCISHSGRTIAVTQPGTRNLQLYRVRE